MVIMLIHFMKAQKITNLTLHCQCVSFRLSTANIYSAPTPLQEQERTLDYKKYDDDENVECWMMMIYI